MTKLVKNYRSHIKPRIGSESDEPLAKDKNRITIQPTFSKGLEQDPTNLYETRKMLEKLQRKKNAIFNSGSENLTIKDQKYVRVQHFRKNTR